MSKFHRRRQTRQDRMPHPDGEIELKLARIHGLRASINRQVGLIAAMKDQIEAAGSQQNADASRLRGSGQGDRRSDFEVSAAAQAARIDHALAAITSAEEFIAAREEEIARLAGELSAEDLAYLN